MPATARRGCPVLVAEVVSEVVMADFGARAAKTPSPSTQHPAPGAGGRSMLGPYRIEMLLGRGGMSSVYRALQTTLDRPVAIKLLPEEFAGDPIFVARFLQEARAAAALQHPHIIPIYDSGQVDGRYYIAMRYVDGVPLARAIPENGLTVERCLYIVEQIASALDYAHSRGVVHRDVSAGNVMLEAGDRVTLMDFGIAQARQGSRLTRAGVAVGTLEYLSPEQARGEPATGQADVYALGVLTYELLTGKLPFTAADDRGLLLQHLNAAPPSIRRLRPDIPAGIDAALHRCLAKAPQARFLSAAAFVTALNAALAASRRQTTSMATAPGQPPAAPPATRTLIAASAKQLSQPRGTTASKQPPLQAGRSPERPPNVGAARPTLSRHRRLPRWAPLLLVPLLLALGGVAYGQHRPSIGSAGSVVSSVERTLSSRASSLASGLNSGRSVAAPSHPTATAVPPAPTALPTVVPVRPALPGEAVDGFYRALNGAFQKGHNAAAMAAAYAYLSPIARFQLPFTDFQRQYASDTNIAWSWPGVNVAADNKTASIPVDVTEYRSGGNAVSRVGWVVVNTGANGWHLDHSAVQASAPATVASVDVLTGDPGNARNNGKGQAKGHGKGE